MPLPESTALRLRSQLDCLPTLLTGVTEEALARQLVSGKWSARQNLAHLARYQEVFLSRLRRMRSEQSPLLPRYRAEDDPAWPLWIDRATKDILKILSAQRTILMQEVQRMTNEDFARTAIHPRFGVMTTVEWLEFFLLHEAHHLLAVLQRSREQAQVGERG